jgi:phytoene dehydrogenase-like protein
MAQYDVVVVGAGLGGLTAGAILARAGRKVLIIERSARLRDGRNKLRCSPT